MQATEAEALRVNEKTHQKAISAAAAAHSEALQATAAGEAAAMSRLERIRESPSTPSASQQLTAAGAIRLPSMRASDRRRNS